MKTRRFSLRDKATEIGTALTLITIVVIIVREADSISNRLDNMSNRLDNMQNTIEGMQMDLRHFQTEVKSDVNQLRSDVKEIDRLSIRTELMEKRIEKIETGN